jgi:hypothetical protein
MNFRQRDFCTSLGDCSGSSRWDALSHGDICDALTKTPTPPERFQSEWKLGRDIQSLAESMRIMNTSFRLQNFTRACVAGASSLLGYLAPELLLAQTAIDAADNSQTLLHTAECV